MTDSGGSDESSPRPEGSAPGPVSGSPPPHLTRGFLFADLRDYTGYIDEHGDHAAALLLERYRALVRAAVAATGGAEIKTEGDSFYVVFDSASAAVRCGQEIISAADAAPGEPIHVGVGVHAGETVETAEGYVGSAVNIAARLCSQARPGELVVSDTVRALTRTYLDVDFEPLGSRRLKGVNDQIGLYRVVPHALGARARTASGSDRRLPLLGGLAIALIVLGAAAVALVGRPGAAPAASPSSDPSGAATSVAPSPAASAGASSAGSAGGSTGEMSPEEQILKERIPSEFQSYCIPSSASQGSLGGSASLQCILPAGQDWSGADMVWYDQFDAAGALSSAVEDVAIRQQLAQGQCDADTTGVIGSWSKGITLNGALGCYTRDGAAWILWTYQGERIAVRAMRRDGDGATLYRWWNDTAPYLRAG